MPTNAVKTPKLKETNPGWKGAKKGTKVKMKSILGSFAGNPTKSGGIFRPTKSKK